MGRFIHHQNHTILANVSVIQKSWPPNNKTASLVSKHYSYSVMKEILMKSFHYSRWHSAFCFYIFFCASETKRQRQEVCCGTASPIFKAKQNTGHTWGSQDGMKISIICNVRWRGLVDTYWRFGQNVLLLWRYIFPDRTGLIVQNDNLQSRSVFMSWRRLT